MPLKALPPKFSDLVREFAHRPDHSSTVGQDTMTVEPFVLDPLPDTGEGLAGEYERALMAALQAILELEKAQVEWKDAYIKNRVEKRMFTYHILLEADQKLLDAIEARDRTRQTQVELQDMVMECCV